MTTSGRGEPSPDKAAVSYIRQNRGKYSDASIRASLEKSGHSKEAVERAFRYADKTQEDAVVERSAVPVVSSPVGKAPKKSGLAQALRAAGFVGLGAILFFGLEGAFRLTAGRRLSPATWSEELQSYTPPRYQPLDRLHLLIPDGSARGDAAEEYFLIAGDETESPDMKLVGRAVGKSECRLLGVRWSPTHWKTLALMPGLAVRLSAAAREYQNLGVAAAKNGDREAAYREFERAAQVGAHMLGSWSPAMRYTGASSLVATGLKSAKYLRWGVESEERRQLAFLFKDIRANLPEASELSAIVSETQDPGMIIGLRRFLSGGGDRSVYLAWILNGVVLNFTEAEAARGALAPQRWAFLKEVAAHSDPRAAALGAAYLEVAKSVESELQSPSDSSARVREIRTLNNKMRHTVDRLKLKF